MSDVFQKLLALYTFISLKRKYQLLLILILTIFSSILEAVSLGAIIPLLNFFNNPNDLTFLESNKLFNFLLTFENIEFVIFAKFFIVLIVISTCLRLILIWASNYVSQTIYADLSLLLFANSISLSYLEYKNMDSNDTISNILIKSSTIQSSITSIINIVISLIMVTFIFLTLIYVQFELTIYILLILAIFYTLLSKKISSIFRYNGKVIAKQVPYLHQLINSSIRSYKQIILNKFHFKYLSKFMYSLIKIRDVTVSNIFLSQSPRYLLEGLTILIITLYLLSVFSSSSNNFTEISVIAFIAASGQRLLPIINALYSNFMSLNSNHQSLTDVLSGIRQKKHSLPLINNKKFEFKKTIEIKQINFKYKNSKKITIRNFSLNIKKGEKVAIVGESGAGKSTLVDIIMGLIKPSSGKILVDGLDINKDILSWQNNISTVSQDPYLFNMSVKDNLNLFNNLKKNKIDSLVNIFKLNDLISLNKIGDNGALISGGQRQRIALAQAFSLNKDLVILDESTNAIDLLLEAKILKNVFSIFKDTTVIIIAHRNETIKLCDRVINFKK